MCLCQGDVTSLFIHRYSRCFAHLSQSLMFNANVTRGQQCDLSRIRDAVNMYGRDESSPGSKSQGYTPRAKGRSTVQTPDAATLIIIVTKLKVLLSPLWLASLPRLAAGVLPFRCPCPGRRGACGRAVLRTPN